MTNTAASESASHTDGGHHDHVLVKVITTSGPYPKTGEDRVKAATRISLVLADAASDLRLADTAGWVARVGGDHVDAAKTFAEEGLHGNIKINWGPAEGGGG